MRTAWLPMLYKWALTLRIRNYILWKLRLSPSVVYEVVSVQVLNDNGNILERFCRYFLSFRAMFWWIMHRWNTNKHPIPFEKLKGVKMNRKRSRQGLYWAFKWCIFETEFDGVPKHKLQWSLLFSFLPLMSECFINLKSGTLGHNCTA